MQDEGVLEREEASLVKHALNFDELEIGHITIPLLKVIKISNSFTSEKVFDVAVKANHTRLPVLKGNSKEIMGYIIADEIFKYVIENNTKNFD
jgi:CBS domain containing-hemolysin-like protein